MHLTPEYLHTPLSTLLSLRDDFLDNLTACTLCPHSCKVNRTNGKVGFCQAPDHLVIGSSAVHQGEEPPISGVNGSGTVFYSYCTLVCLYCQNYPLSQLHHGNILTEEDLSEMFLTLQKKGCHNINWVSPTQFLPFILSSLLLAREKGLHVPIVYNCSGWENEWVLTRLKYFIDIYLPDSRYSNNETAFTYSKANHYVEINQKALLLMRENQPDDLWEDDLIKKGLIVRVLILPNHAEETITVLRNLRGILGKDTYISLMSQYFPCHKALEHPLLNRVISKSEYESVQNEMNRLGFEKGWVQDYDPT